MIDHDKLSLLVATPSQDSWRAEFGQCLQRMMVHTALWMRENGGRIEFAQDFGTLLSCMRENLADLALELGATHILWLDNDMTFPDDTAVRLLNRKQPIVAANYCQRRAPFRPVAKDRAGHWIYTYPISTGLEEGAACGMGCMLMETSILAAMSKPWFMVLPADDDGKMIGEDFYFCGKQSVEVGEPVWIDHDLSKGIGHVGKSIFDFTHALNDRAVLQMIQDGELEEPRATPRPHERYAHLMDIEKEITAEEYREMSGNFMSELADKEAAKRARIREQMAPEEQAA